MLHKDFRPSKLEQYNICPGSFQMQIGLEQEAGEDANEGTTLHKAVQMGVEFKDKLTVEQATCAERCQELLSKLKMKAYMHEQEVSLVGEDFNVLISGTADVIAVDEEARHGILIDWKFGRLPVPPVRTNLQMRAYASAMFQNHDVDVIDVYIFQPRVKNGLDKHTYNRKELGDFPIKLMAIWERCNKGIILNPSKEACQYCKAKENCPAFARWGDSSKADLMKIEHTSALTIDQMPKALEQAQIAKSIVKQLEEKISGIEKRAKEFLIENQQIEGWTIKTKQGNRICNHPNQLWGALSNVMHEGKPLLTVEEFMGCVDISIRELEELFCKTAKSTKFSKTEKEAKIFLEKTIIPYIGRKADSLILKKTTQEDE